MTTEQSLTTENHSATVLDEVHWRQAHHNTSSCCKLILAEGVSAWFLSFLSLEADAGFEMRNTGYI